MSVIQDTREPESLQSPKEITVTIKQDIVYGGGESDNDKEMSWQAHGTCIYMVRPS